MVEMDQRKPEVEVEVQNNLVMMLMKILVVKVEWVVMILFQVMCLKLTLF